MNAEKFEYRYLQALLRQLQFQKNYDNENCIVKGVR